MAENLARFTFDGGTAQSVAAGGTVSFTQATGGSCVAALSNGNAVQLKQPGTYRVTAEFTLLGTGDGAVQVQMLENGTAAPGARAAETLASGGFASLGLSDFVTVKPGAAGTFAALTFALSAAASVQTAMVLIEKVGK